MEGRGGNLSGIELFADVATGNREALARACRWRRYAAHQEIIGHLDEATDVFFIVDGRVRVTVHSPAGKEVAFRDLGPGKSFGELAAIDGGPRSASCVALDDSVIAAMTAEAFRRALHDHPEVSARLSLQLAGYVRQLSERVFEFSTLAVKNRIHAELLRLAREGGEGDNAAVIRPAPTHADIAARVSTHREAVTRELNALARAGLIDRRGRDLLVTDLARLARMVEDMV